MTSPSPTDCAGEKALGGDSSPHAGQTLTGGAPWVLTGGCHLVGDPDGDGQHNLYVGEVRIDGRIGSVCTIQSADHVPPYGITRDEAAAHARLIAAAPELLEALCRVLPWAREQDVGGPDIGADLDFARAALSKATGESQ
jgi:hypothetical protein